MQAQAIQDTSVQAVPTPRKRTTAQSVPEEASAPKNNAGEPSPARILTDAFEDLRRRMATLEGRIIEGSNTGEVARIAQILERVEGRLGESVNGSTALSKHVSSKLLIAFLTLSAFGIGFYAAENAVELRAVIDQVTFTTSTFLQAGLDRIGELRLQ